VNKKANRKYMILESRGGKGLLFWGTSLR